MSAGPAPASGDRSGAEPPRCPVESLAELEAVVGSLTDRERVSFARWASVFVTEHGMPRAAAWPLYSEEHRAARRIRERFEMTGDGTITEAEARDLHSDAAMEAVWNEGAMMVYELAWALVGGDPARLSSFAPVRRRLAAPATGGDPAD